TLTFRSKKSSRPDQHKQNGSDFSQIFHKKLLIFHYALTALEYDKVTFFTAQWTKLSNRLSFLLFTIERNNRQR
ncbi:MAG: hypothetical protein PQJ60_06465, partial [Spirochaetales bacterium]|nr:hypothetical protein [Spirochaetales bacterium]